MEHREPSRMATEAGSDPLHGRRFARLIVSPAGRRVTPTRLVLAGLALAGAVLLIGGVGAQVARWLVAYLDGQAPYQLPFREITLEPAPPPWYRGGTARFLERVRASTPARGETISLLQEDLARLATDFRLYCWVARVLRVRRSYHRVVVELEYRKPVALAQLPGHREIVVDRNGVILPREDLDEERVGRLIWISDLEPPADPRPGLPWSIGDEAQGLAQADPRVVAAAQMAEFLKTVATGEDASLPMLGFMAVHPITPHRLWVELDAQFMILWGEPPGAEPPGELSADAKWAMLRHWTRQNDPRTIRHPDYLMFSKSGIVPVRSRSPRDDATSGRHRGG